MAEYTTLDLTIISANSLHKLKLIGKMDVYAVAYIVSDNNSNKQDQKQKTPVHKNGDTNPKWNCPMTFIFALQESVTLVFEIKSEGLLFGDKDVGKAYVPVKELLERYNEGSDQVIEFVSNYEVRKPSGKPKGELTFSFKFTDTSDPNEVDEPTAVASTPDCPPPGGDDTPGGYSNLAIQDPPPGCGDIVQLCPAAYPPSYGGYAGYLLMVVSVVAVAVVCDHIYRRVL